MSAPVLACFTIFAATVSMIALASDPSPLQDFCVATNDPNNAVFVNGYLCKNPTQVTVDDFVSKGGLLRRNTSNALGISNTLITPANLPGLNSLGLSIQRQDYAAGGLAPPHEHPRATEVITVISGTLNVGFISGANRLFSKVLSPGDVFVFPQGLVHFVINVGETDAWAIAAYGSQTPGGLRLPTALFGAQPPIPVDVLSRAFQLEPKIVEGLQFKFLSV